MWKKKSFHEKKYLLAFFLNLSYLMDYVSGTILLCNTQLEYMGAVTVTDYEFLALPLRLLAGPISVNELQFELA